MGVSRRWHIEAADAMAGLTPEAACIRLDEALKAPRDEFRELADAAESAACAVGLAIETESAESRMQPGCSCLYAANPSWFGFCRPCRTEHRSLRAAFAWDDVLSYLNGLGLSLQPVEVECWRDFGPCRICRKVGAVGSGFCRECGSRPFPGGRFNPDEYPVLDVVKFPY